MNGKNIKGVVSDLKSTVIKGDTVYFFKVDGIYKGQGFSVRRPSYLENGQSFEGQVGRITISRALKSGIKETSVWTEVLRWILVGLKNMLH